MRPCVSVAGTRGPPGDPPSWFCFGYTLFRFDEHLARAGEIFFNLLELAVLLDDFFELGVLLGDFLIARGIGSDFGGRELLRQLVVAGAKLIQFFRKRKNGHCSTSRVFSDQLTVFSKKKESSENSISSLQKNAGSRRGSERRVS